MHLICKTCKVHSVPVSFNNVTLPSRDLQRQTIKATHPLNRALSSLMWSSFGTWVIHGNPPTEHVFLSAATTHFQFLQVFARKSNRNETPRNTGHVMNVWCLEFFRLNQKEMLFYTLKRWKTVFLYVKTMKTYDSDIMWHQPFCVTQKKQWPHARQGTGSQAESKHTMRGVSWLGKPPWQWNHGTRASSAHTTGSSTRAEGGFPELDAWRFGQQDVWPTISEHPSSAGHNPRDTQSTRKHTTRLPTDSKLAHPWSTTDRLHKWGLSQVGKRDMLVLPSPLLSLRLLKHVFLVGAVLHVIPRGAFQTGNVKICHISWIATAKSLNNVAFWRVWVKWVWHPSH